MSIDIVNDALKYYDLNNEKYNHIKRHIKYFQLYPNNDNEIETLRLVFFDENKKELFTSRCEILGKYFRHINVWIWGWSLPKIPKYLSSIIRKVFLYGTDIDLSNVANTILKNELVTSRFRIEDEIQLDIHCAIASYLSKKPFIFPLKGIPTDNYDRMIDVSTNVDKNIIYYMFIIDPPDV